MICLSLILQAQSSDRDTIYIKYDKKNLIKDIHLNGNYVYYYLKNTGNNGAFFFKELRCFERKSSNLKQHEIMNLKKLVAKEQFYNGVNNTTIIDDWELWLYFRKKTIFLIGNNSIMELEANYVIE